MAHLDDRTLKKLSLTFRDVAGRALRSDEHDAQGNLRRLLALVRQTPLLSEEVGRAPAPTESGAALWHAARESGERLELPEDPLEELGVLQQVVEHLSSTTEEFWRECYGYAGERGVNEGVEEVLGDVVQNYVNHLNRVIEMALLDSNDPAYGPARGISIRVEGGTNQLNLAQDEARIDASQQVGDGATAVVAAARELAQLADAAELPVTLRDDLKEVAVAVAEEAARPTPNRFTLRKAKESLETLAAGVGAAGTIGTKIHQLVEFVRGIIP